MTKMFVLPVSRKYLTVAICVDNLLRSNQIPKTAVIAVDKNCQIKRRKMMNPILKGTASANDEIVQNKRSVSGVSGQCPAAHSAKEISTPMMMMNTSTAVRRKREDRMRVKKTKRIVKKSLKKASGGLAVLDRLTSSKPIEQEPVTKTIRKKRNLRKAQSVANGLTSTIDAQTTVPIELPTISLPPQDPKTMTSS